MHFKLFIVNTGSIEQVSTTAAGSIHVKVDFSWHGHLIDFFKTDHSGRELKNKMFGGNRLFLSFLD